MSFVKYFEYVNKIHRMQIWRTTRSAPGTSHMKARLVRLWCFVLTNAFQKSLASLSIWSLCFALATRFCVPECHRNRVNSSTAVKVFFFSVSSFASGRKPKRLGQGVHDRWRNCLSSGWKILENVWAIAFSFKLLSFGLRWFPSFALCIPTAHDFCVISTHKWARVQNVRDFPQIKLNSVINARFLFDELLTPTFYFINSMRTISEKNIGRNLWLLFWQMK